MTVAAFDYERKWERCEQVVLLKQLRQRDEIVCVRPGKTLLFHSLGQSHTILASQS